MTAKAMVTDSSSQSESKQDTPRVTPDAQAPTPRRTWLTFCVLVALAFAISLPSLGNWATLAPDSSEYLAAAGSLVENGGFPAKQLMRPPGFPVLIAPLMLSDKMPLFGLRLLLVTCWALAAGAAYLLYRHELGQATATVVGILVALNTVLFYQTTVILTEPVFLVLALGSLLAAIRWKKGTPVEWTEMVLVGWLTAATMMMRSIGVVLFPVLVWVLLCRRCDSIKKRLVNASIFTLCAITPYIGWQFRQYNYPASYGYNQMWTHARSAEQTEAEGVALQMERLATFGPMRLAGLRDAVIPQRIGGWRLSESPYNLLSTYLVGGLFVLAAIVRLVVRRSPVDAFFLLTLLVVSLWPWDEGVRLVSALIPVLYGYLLWIGVWLYRMRKGLWLRGAALAGLVLLLSANVWEMGVAQARVDEHRTKAETRLDMVHILADWQIANTPTKPRIVAVLCRQRDTKPMMAAGAYLSQRTIKYIEVTQDEAIELSLESERYSYVFVDDALYGYVAPETSHIEIDAAGPFVIYAPASSVRMLSPE